MKNDITLEYAARPSLVAKRVGTRLRMEGTQTLHQGEHFAMIFEPEDGLILLDLSSDHLAEGMSEIESTLFSLRLPLHSEESLIHARNADPSLLESAGFTRDPLLKRWAWKHVLPETLSLTRTVDK
jgi:hypothetical protein